jgi:hypothetical protein
MGLVMHRYSLLQISVTAIRFAATSPVW